MAPIPIVNTVRNEKDIDQNSAISVLAIVSVIGSLILVFSAAFMAVCACCAKKQSQDDRYDENVQIASYTAPPFTRRDDDRRSLGRRRGSDNERARGSREGLKRRTTSRGRLSKPSPGCKLKKKQFRIVIVKPCEESEVTPTKPSSKSDKPRSKERTTDKGEQSKQASDRNQREKRTNTRKVRYQLAMKLLPKDEKAAAKKDVKEAKQEVESTEIRAKGAHKSDYREVDERLVKTKADEQKKSNVDKRATPAASVQQSQTPSGRQKANANQPRKLVSMRPPKESLNEDFWLPASLKSLKHPEGDKPRILDKEKPSPMAEDGYARLRLKEIGGYKKFSPKHSTADDVGRKLTTSGRSGRQASIMPSPALTTSYSVNSDVRDVTQRTVR